MNSVTRRRNVEDVISDGLGYGICFVVGLMFAIDFLRCQIFGGLKVSRDHLKALAIITTIFAFTPGAFCLLFYVFTDVKSVDGVARGMSWWWIWLT